MKLEKLRDQATTCIRLLVPQLGDASILVDECLASAEKSFSSEFILSLSPQAWAKITIIYHKHFLDTGSDVPVGEMVAEVVRDSIDIKRIDFLTQSLAVKWQYQQERPECDRTVLSLVKNKR
ncbi:MAG: hypothetical protein ABW139_10125 [Candidatus Thiodiazotropha sp. DIVDIV]